MTESNLQIDNDFDTKLSQIGDNTSVNNNTCISHLPVVTAMQPNYLEVDETNNLDAIKPLIMQRGHSGWSDCHA